MICLSFTEQEAQAAYDEWGCNCGPCALAFALQVKLDAVRHAIPDFDARRYTSPTMMKAALKNLGKVFTAHPGPAAALDAGAMMFSQRENICLVRIQWTGPWTKTNANPKWAYRQTHWIATYRLGGGAFRGVISDDRVVFDCNGGANRFQEWKDTIVPLIVAQVPRADGGWFPTHVWRIDS